MDDENGIKYFFRIYWKSMFAVLWPFVILPVLITGAPYPDMVHFRCLYAFLFVAGYWISACWPHAITGYAPMVLLPGLTVAGSNLTAVNYLNTYCMFAVICSVYGLAMETSNLHRRFILSAMKMFGAGPRSVHFGLVMGTMFLSMWAPNMLIATIICPVVAEVLQDCDSQGIMPHLDKETGTTSSTSSGYYIGVAYAATIGGMATYMGTGTNILYRGLVFDGYAPARYPRDTNLFSTWIVVGLPITIITTILMWIWLQMCYFGLFRPSSVGGVAVASAREKTDKIREIIKAKQTDLGPWTFQQVMTMLILMIGVVVLLIRRPEIYGEDFILRCRDSLMLFIINALLIIFPKSLVMFKSFSKNEEERPTKPEGSLIPWGKFEKSILWDHITVIGGGFALSYGMRESELRAWIGERIVGLLDLEPLPLLIVVCVACSVVTSFAWNMCTCALILPFLSIYSNVQNWNPILLCKGAALACSHSFCTSFGTPTNGLIHDTYKVRRMELFKAGLPVKFLALCVLLVFYPLIAWPVYDLDHINHLFYNTTTPFALPDALPAADAGAAAAAAAAAAAT